MVGQICRHRFYGVPHVHKLRGNNLREKSRNPASLYLAGLNLASRQLAGLSRMHDSIMDIRTSSNYVPGINLEIKIFLCVAILVAGALQSCGAMQGNAPPMFMNVFAAHFVGFTLKN